MDVSMYRCTLHLTSALVAGGWLASSPGLFTAGERAPGTHWKGSHSRSGQRGEEKVLDSTGTRTPKSYVVEALFNRYTDWVIAASWTFGLEKKSLSVTGIETWLLGRQASKLVTIPTELSQLLSLNAVNGAVLVYSLNNLKIMTAICGNAEL
jgi:hypothetical protein